jgi:hypothetical protein
MYYSWVFFEKVVVLLYYFVFYILHEILSLVKQNIDIEWYQDKTRHLLTLDYNINISEQHMDTHTDSEINIKLIFIN